MGGGGSFGSDHWVLGRKESQAYTRAVKPIQYCIQPSLSGQPSLASEELLSLSEDSYVHAPIATCTSAEIQEERGE